MGERIDYLNDPDAPRANSLVPSANVIVVNDQDEILMIRRTDNDNWAVPGGGMDPGESITDTAVRETEEETGITCEITGLVGRPAHQPAARDPLHQQRRGPAGILHRLHRPARRWRELTLSSESAGAAVVLPATWSRACECTRQCASASSTTSTSDPSPTSAELPEAAQPGQPS